MPWTVAVAAISAGTAIYGANRSDKTTDKAIAAERGAADRAIGRQEDAFENAQTLLSPYARQEQAASNQLMTQMGIAPSGGGGWGHQDPGSLSGGGSGNRELDLFMRDMLADQVAISKRAGYNEKNGKAQAEGARRAEMLLRQMQDQGQLPEGMELPTYDDLYGQASELTAQGFGFDNYGRSADGEKIQGTGPGAYEKALQTLEGYGGQEIFAQAPGDDQRMAPAGAPGGALTADDIMARAGVEGVPEGLQDQYYQDLMGARDPIDLGAGEFMSDEYQNYMGLTPESLQVGNEYQDTGAYQAAREQGMEAVNQGAAGTGSLYSGRRGEALRDVGQDVEQQYYMDAMNRRADMMGSRRQTYGAELGRRLAERADYLGRMGSEVSQGRQQQQSYYNNYMQMLSQMASPQTTTNLASLEMGIGKDTGAILQDTTRATNNLSIANTNAQNQMMGDVAGGVVDLGSAWLSK